MPPAALSGVRSETPLLLGRHLASGAPPLGIRERKERHKRELRQSILDAAEELFVQDGYQNVSMRRIAEKIEYSPTTLYRFFRDKADIVDQLIAQGYRGVYERYDEILADRPASPLETLNRVIDAYVAFGLEHPNHYQLWFATSEIRIVDGELRMQHGGRSYHVYHVWLDLIDECKSAGLLPAKDTLVLFQLIWGAVHGLISLRIHHPHFPWLPLDRHVAELLALLDRGLGPA
jgi:AcrR family transcriptional regulator